MSQRGIKISFIWRDLSDHDWPVIDKRELYKAL